MIDSATLTSLDERLQPFAAWLGTFALHSTIALALTYTISRAWRSGSLSLRDHLLRQAMWLPLVSATLQHTLLGNVWAHLLREPELTIVELAPLISGLALEDSGAAAPALAEPVAATPMPWALLVTSLAAAAALIGLGCLWRTWRRLNRVLAERRPETDARVLASAAELAGELGLRQSPHVSRAEGLSTPIAFGLMRPEICLPARVGTLDEASLRAMLGHELAHLRRRDPAWMWLAAAVQAVFPWQLLLVSVRRQWSRIVELRCDAEAAHHTSPTAVARCLIEVAEWLRPEPQPAMVALGMAARRSALRERVEAALGAPAPATATRFAATGLAAVSLATLTVAAPGLGTVDSFGATESVFVEAARDPHAHASRFEPFLSLIDAEYAVVVDETRALQRQLRMSLAPNSAQLQEALESRLQSLSRLRARLLERVGRNPDSHPSSR